MSEQDIIGKLIFQLGQSQRERFPRELGAGFADIDERTSADLLEIARSLAESVHFYRDNPVTPSGDWSTFFGEDIIPEELLQGEKADIPPHLALFLTFLELYKQPQSEINKITARHLDFYYRDVLRNRKKTAIADRVHVLLELKKNVAPVRILPENLFSAGKDPIDRELLYAPTRETVINAASVVDIRSIFLDRSGRGTIRRAPIAKSSDGLGGKLPENEPKWSGFGHKDLPIAEVGFSIASPVLRMREGTRKVIVSLELQGVDFARINNQSLQNAFDVYITAEKSWLSRTVSPKIGSNNVLTFDFTVAASEPAIVDYNREIHGYSYDVRGPIVQILIRAGNNVLGYLDFDNVTVEAASVAVEVSGIASLNLNGDGGAIDPKKAFLPFGPRPTRGSRFSIDYPEAFAKKLSEVSITIDWKDTPTNFNTHYQHYGVSNITNSSFTTNITFQDGGSWAYTGSKPLFNSNNATVNQTLTFMASSPSVSPKVSEGMKVHVLSAMTSAWARETARNLILQNPALASYQSEMTETTPRALVFSLDRDFLQETYRKKYIENVMKYGAGKTDTLVILNEPYIPAIESVTLAYKARCDRVKISSLDLADFVNPDLDFFHVSYFGVTREHGYQRQQLEMRIKAGISPNISLLPKYTHAGEMLIGFDALHAGDSVSVLFQVAEGSANPDVVSENLSWFVLCDNYWQPLDRSEVILDTTNQLLTSGIIQFVIPLSATKENTVLPSDLIWIKVSISNNSNAVCQFIDVVANAIEARFIDRGNDPEHLQTALEPGKITRFQDGISAIKTVKQPYASFGGTPVETDIAFYTRVSERLRHKNRCITPWDYERIILEAFPKIHKVKCIPHATENSWLSPGNVLIVVIPDLRNKNAIDPLAPKVDANTLDRITEHVVDRAGMQVKIKVKNPTYQKIKLDFKVRFYPEYEFNFYKTLLEREIIQFLSPWAYDIDREISFGGKIYKSVLLDFVEDLTYVDYVTDFKMYSFTGEIPDYTDSNEVRPRTPATILVSDSTHLINPIG
ncbi:baseplate J/gp47 family protein [Pannus brasiliensis CCIBt3594]|uniref:Baseplate J/gp47 family protein n=1 Tax=Pannus brasiliensis CCIBt3594 TaxID=1427578 RepID=A0AAW9QUQ0_9CHRO